MSSRSERQSENILRAASAIGICAAIVAVTGCSESQPLIGTPARAANAASNPPRKALPEYMYVANDIQVGSSWSSAISIYPAAANGNVYPSMVISGSQTQLMHLAGIVVSASGEIYVANEEGSILGFAPGSSGDASPNVVISGSQTELSRPTGLSLDSKGNIYVANCASGCGVGSQPPAVLEFSAKSNGNVAPIRNISGSETEFENANDVVLDASREIYVSDYVSNGIYVFASDANGNVQPIRAISGSDTLLNQPDGIAVDRDGLYAGSAADHFVERFKVTANGNAPPRVVISGTKTHLLNVDGIALDSRGAIYASNPGNKRILKFAAMAHGNAEPIADIHGSNTGLVLPVWVYVR
jgi:sugar lactone lactonase YvrE